MKALLSIFLFLFQTALFAQNWQPNFDQAISKAQTESKHVILVFSGSDWCAPCIKLDREIWQSDAFKDYAKDHWILYRADFPRKKSNQLNEELKATNQKLFEKYNKAGAFPEVVVLNAKGDVLGITGYKDITPQEYIKHLNSFER